MSDIRLYRVMRDLEGKHCGNEYLGNLVTCGECKHNVGLTNGFWEEDIVCDYWESDGLTTDDFCSYGERNTND